MAQQQFLELDNGKINLRLAADGSRLEITSAGGLLWEMENLITVI